MKWLQKKSPEDLRTNKFLNRASSEVNGFAELLQRFERNISILAEASVPSTIIPVTLQP
ncbi:hypothetical protein LDL59_06490 [Kaistella anthropi]|nr:hypothetical protein [Kaistella anthropi]